MPSINIPLTDEELTELKKFKKKGENWKEFIQSSLWFKGCTIREPHTEFGEKWKVDPPFKIEKPCHTAGYCPFGQLVEAFTLKLERDEVSCTVFGHDCPAFYCSEPFSENV